MAKTQRTKGYLPVELIAEVSSNHGGSMALAKEFIHRFAEAGATWIKFQHTRVKHLRPDDPQYEWFKRSELSVEQFAELKAECEQAGTQFLTTVYNAQDVPEVARLGLEAIKIGSGEANDHALGEAVAQWPRRIVSCGIGPVSPWHVSCDLLKCVTRYPCPHGMCGSRKHYGRGAPHQGWSDHCVGIESCQVAILRGATIIEKHVQLPNQARPPRLFEATMEEFKALRAFADDNPSDKFLGRWQHV